ncbi:unnamed protein product [Meganyctiphanes norvegica]|uniref:Uncharacterized protein n=1 Tax=Meganyctiphanes norvegica TaxID=48144 RepID=A0AAV2Q1A5_MEGNR
MAHQAPSIQLMVLSSRIVRVIHSIWVAISLVLYLQGRLLPIGRCTEDLPAVVGVVVVEGGWVGIVVGEGDWDGHEVPVGEEGVAAVHHGEEEAKYSCSNPRP